MQKEGGFDGITEETDFYLNEAGDPVVVFAPYEIAPGAAGTVEFCDQIAQKYSCRKTYISPAAVMLNKEIPEMFLKPWPDYWNGRQSRWFFDGWHFSEELPLKFRCQAPFVPVPV